MTSGEVDQALAGTGASDVPAAVAHVYPGDSRVNGSGRLEIGGCDALELAREFGTPAYVYAEDDLRSRARATRAAFAQRCERFEVLYASKAFPCTAALELFREEGLSVDVASGGELHLALGAGFEPARICLHGNNKSDAELQRALDVGVGHVIVDSFDELDRFERIAPGSGQRVLLRVAPGIEPATHEKIATGQEDSKFGLPLALVPAAIERCEAVGLQLGGVHAHIGSQVFALDVYDLLGETLASIANFDTINVGGGFAVAYTRDQRPPAPADFAEAMVRALPAGVKVLCEPGRSLVANAGVTLYTVGTVKEVPGVRTYVATDGGMADNIRPMLYGAIYEADIVDRMGDGELCRIVGMHCESGDVLVPEGSLREPRPGDVLVIPATGAYGHAMASNYNAVPRPPVVFCSGGDARLVVRRETLDDLVLRDV